MFLISSSCITVLQSLDFHHSINLFSTWWKFKCNMTDAVACFRWNKICTSNFVLFHHSCRCSYMLQALRLQATDNGRSLLALIRNYMLIQCMLLALLLAGVSRNSQLRGMCYMQQETLPHGANGGERTADAQELLSLQPLQLPSQVSS